MSNRDTTTHAVDHMHDTDPSTARERLELDIHTLATIVERDGVAGADPCDIAALALEAREAGASPVIVGVLASSDEPDVARVRAFARVTAFLVTAVLAAGHAGPPAAAAIPAGPGVPLPR